MRKAGNGRKPSSAALYRAFLDALKRGSFQPWQRDPFAFTESWRRKPDPEPAQIIRKAA